MSGKAGLVMAALGLVAVACPAQSGSFTEVGSPPSPTPRIEIPHVKPGGAPTLEEAIDSLCIPPSPFGDQTGPPGETPPAVAEVASQVERVRGGRFVEPIAAEAVSDEDMDAKLLEAFEASYPKAFYDRRTIAWRTIGVIPPDADIRESLRAFMTGQVVGFYNPTDGELVYLGEGEIGLVERMVLAHELTHALDDQRFDLTRLDDIAATCRDEAFAAALAVAEGSAQYYSAQVLATFPDLDMGDLAEALQQVLGGRSNLEDVPPFVQELQTWPYMAGQAFVTDLVLAGGNGEVDRALKHLPTTTEQILHPERLPADEPVEVEIGDLTRELGQGWGDLDAMEIGEAWLRAMLALRIPGFEADQAAAGWDGGAYRAFTDGSDVFVVMRTAWDTQADAQDFVSAVAEWSSGDRKISVSREAEIVTVVFVSDEGLLAAAA